MGVPTQLPGHQAKERNNEHPEVLSPANGSEKKASSTIYVLDNSDNSTGGMHLKQSANKSTNSDINSDKGIPFGLRDGTPTYKKIGISDLLETPQISKGVLVIPPSNGVEQPPNPPPQTIRESIETDNGPSAISELAGNNSNRLSSQAGANIYDSLIYDKLPFDAEVVVGNRVHILPKEVEYVSTDAETSFMKDFACCGKNLANLHDLLQHYEEAHTQTHATTPGIIESEPTKVLTLSPSNLTKERVLSPSEEQRDTGRAYSTRQLDEGLEDEIFRARLPGVKSLQPNQLPDAESLQLNHLLNNETSVATPFGSKVVVSQLFDGPHVNTDGSLKEPLDCK
jgi:hypothetical protein